LGRKSFALLKNEEIKQTTMAVETRNFLHSIVAVCTSRLMIAGTTISKSLKSYYYCWLMENLYWAPASRI
jgi:hypothetical protein